MFPKQKLLDKINSHSAVIGVIGLGYVGLPLALEFAERNFNVMGFDIDEKKIPVLNSGKSYIKHIPSERIKANVESKKFLSTFDFSLLTSCDCILICVPTPLNEHREPDVSYIENSGKEIAKYLSEGQLVVLESSTYPGTTEEILLPMFEEVFSRQNSVGSKEHKVDSNVISSETGDVISGGAGDVISSGARDVISSGARDVISSGARKLESKLSHPAKPAFEMTNYKYVGDKFFLAFSPEREDPNNPNFSTSTIPKVVGGVTANCLEVACALYDKVIVKTVPVSSPKAAEATKLLENIYRSVNIALVNELKMVFDRMEIDIWEVIEAAKTKPFGFTPFYPGPGLGGHCIPIDPFYLTWKAREYDISTKFIELAGEINTSMPYYVALSAVEALNRMGKSINGAKVLIMGASYKKNIDDMRESPSLKLIDIFRKKGAVVDYYDPYVPKLPATRKYKFDMHSIVPSEVEVQSYDLIVISTDHDNVDYKFIVENAQCIVDTRNVLERLGLKGENIFKA